MNTLESAYGPFYLNVGCRVAPGILGISANEVLGVLGNPRMVRCYVVRHEIQEQLHASLSELCPGTQTSTLPMPTPR